MIASGSEVAIALAARARLQADGVGARVVSLPCWELTDRLTEGERAALFGGATLRVGIEAAAPLGWEKWLGPEGLFFGMTTFGASAPYDQLFTHFGLTAQAVVEAVRKRL